MGAWKKIKIGKFLFEREGKYKPDDKIISDLKKIEKISFADGSIHLGKYKLTKTRQIIVEPGDFVFSGLNIEKGSVSINKTRERLVVSANYSACQIDYSIINQEYFLRYIRSSQFKQLLIDNLKKDYGFTRPKHLLPLEIELPDIAEQRKIVAYFKSIETEHRELKHELTHQQTLLKKLRQQILQEAIEGRLTKDWRAQNPNMEPASELLARIQAEKEQLIKDKKIKKQKPLPAITEAEKPFELPEGWVWCRLGEIANAYEAGKSFKCTDRQVSNDEWGVLKTNAITSSIYREKKHKFYQSNAPMDVSKKVMNGDLIFCRASGSKGLAGTCCLVSHVSKNLLLSDKTPRLTFSKSIENMYIYFHNKTEQTETYYLKMNTGKSTSMNNITKDQLFEKPLPLPPLAEQKAIVTKVEKLLALCDQLQTQITENQAYAEQLMQAVLKEAFAHSNESSEKVLVNA